MPKRVFTYYQRHRIINVNLNIIASGLLSTAWVMVLLWFMKAVIGTNWPSWGYTAFSGVADLVLDVSMFALLHWVANHWRPLKGKCENEQAQLAAPRPDPVADGARIQLERAVISPLYYIIALAGTQALQESGMHPAWAVGIAYPAGLLVTRTIHTIWGLRSGTYVDHHRREDRSEFNGDANA